jgi:DNA-directed RNA polymerase specialized sigma24 family protein
VIVLSEIEGLPLDEVAEVVGASEGTVKSRLHYARKASKNF